MFLFLCEESFHLFQDILNDSLDIEMRSFRTHRSGVLFPDCNWINEFCIKAAHLGLAWNEEPCRNKCFLTTKFWSDFLNIVIENWSLIWY
jgi:hypothetical protein